MTRFVAMPSPRGTNNEGLFMRAPGGMAHDAAPDGREAKDRRAARDADIEAARRDLDTHLGKWGNPDAQKMASDLVDALVKACTGEADDDEEEPTTTRKSRRTGARRCLRTRPSAWRGASSIRRGRNSPRCFPMPRRSATDDPHPYLCLRSGFALA